MIKINGLSKSFGNNEVLKNISMKFSKGKAYGIVGENGAGKTTTISMICGLLPVTEGDKLKGIVTTTDVLRYFREHV